MTLIQKINPLNKDSEKKKFLFDGLYNPQFVYPEKLTAAEKLSCGEVSDKYLAHAEKIINTVIKKWENESSFLLAAEGELMTREALTTQVNEYLQQNNIEDKVLLRFSHSLVTPANMQGNVISFRLPIAQRALRLGGTLNHELGTHFFRRLNDELQPWHKKNPSEFGLHPYLNTEEGLATLHAHLFLSQKYLWFAALYYVTVYEANRMSFSELYKFLKKYVDNRDRRWNIALRAKRGMSDTSVPGALGRDQVYMRGMFEVLSWLEEHDYNPEPLYFGKIAVEDVDHVLELSPKYKPKLPTFLLPEYRDSYISSLKEIKKQNMLS